MTQQEDPLRAQELIEVMRLCEAAGPLPRGTTMSAQAKFYAAAQRWIPMLVAHYLRTERGLRRTHEGMARPSNVRSGP